jgi:DNA modification methylase
MVWGGGNNHCEHVWGKQLVKAAAHHAGETNPGIEGYTKDRGAWTDSQGQFCTLCGAWRGAYGLEPTIEMYVQHTVDFLREIKRVLRPDGTIFLNLGDSYFSGGTQRGGQSGTDGKVSKGLKGGDASSESPCGECVKTLLNHNPDNSAYPVQEPELCAEQSNRSRKAQPLDHSKSLRLTSQGDHSEGETLGLYSSPELLDGAVPFVQESTNPESSEQSQGECLHLDRNVSSLNEKETISSELQETNSEVSPSEVDSAFPEAKGLYSHKQDILATDGASASHKKGKASGSSSYRYFTTQHHPSQLKPKDLCLIPFRVALAAQADGWWVRSVIIWAKRNPMPESCTDRPTESHEYILMLTKSASYYWDQEAVRKPYQDIHGLDRFKGSRDYHPAGHNLRSVWEMNTQPFSLEMCSSCKRIYESAQFRRLPDKAGGKKCTCAKTNNYPSWLEVPVEVPMEIPLLNPPIEYKGQTMVKDTISRPQDPSDTKRRILENKAKRQPSVLQETEAMFEFTTEIGYQCELCGEIYTPAEYSRLPEARVKICRCGETNWISHFATFPSELPRRCILAATSEKGCCPKCGKPWVRVVERGKLLKLPEARIKQWDRGKLDGTVAEGRAKGLREGGFIPNYSYGWEPGCSCGETETVPCTVLDPFAGSGTVGVVAKSLGRKAVLIELSEDYCKLAEHQISKVSLPMRGGNEADNRRLSA